jgi:hypothetical protein
MVITINTQLSLTFVLTILWANIADAQVQLINKDASALDVSISTVYADNLNPTLVKDQNAIGVIFAPKGQLVAEGHASQFLVDYSASFERYKLRKDDVMLKSNEDFNDYRVKLLGRVFLAKAWHLDTHVQYLNQQQKFGTGISKLRTNVLQGDQLKQLSGAASLVYGNDTSSRFISLKIHGNEDSYQANNDYSDLFNTSNRGAELNVVFRQSAATSFLLRMSGQHEDYESALREDSDVYRAMLGVGWRPSGKSILEVLVGRFWRESDSRSNDGLSWSINYTLKPTENWKVTLNSARYSDISQSEFTTDSVIQDVHFNAQYNYSVQWRFGLAMHFENTEFNFVSNTTELDEKATSAYVSLILKDNNQIKLSAGKVDTFSSDNLIDYSQLEARLTWQLEF